MRNLIFGAALAISGLFGLSAHAEPVAGQQYVELKSPVPVSKPGKVEVVELFWYGCPHCFHFEPMLEAWVKKLPPDVNFRRLPVAFREVPFVIHQKLYFAASSNRSSRPRAPDMISRAPWRYSIPTSSAFTGVQNRLPATLHAALFAAAGTSTSG